MTLFTRALLGLTTSLVPMAVSGQSQSSSSPQAPLAVVDGQAIYELDLLKVAGPRMAQLRNQEYQVKSQALQAAIRQKLLEREARKRNLEPEALLAGEVDSKIGEPTDSEVEAAYEAQKDRLKRPLEEIRVQLASALKRARIQKARQDFLDSLRGKVEVSVFLRPPTTEVSFDPARLRGDPKAPVTIVEFSDFECPFCVRSQAVLQNVLAKYKGRVRLAFRDFPLRGIHPKAQSAAEASRCAAEQGKFWEYHDALFADSTKLDAEGLAGNARKLELDMSSFESCLSSRKYKAKVEQDLEEGTKAGVEGTPAFFINGVFLSGAHPA
ncbi:MAG: thioredoxin domain-containing protein [Acidobacteriia bacterium]|nr:thioredoxin domain-containing protein [Terriglobia bacterium]